MLQRIQAQINIQIRPMNMVGRYELDVQYAMDARVTEPREIIVRQKVLFVVHKQP